MHDPSDYDSVYSEEDFVDTVRGAATPPLMDYEEFRVKTMGESAYHFGHGQILSRLSCICCRLMKAKLFRFDTRLMIKCQPQRKIRLHIEMKIKSVEILLDNS